MDRNGTFVVVRTAETPLFSERGCFLPPFGVTPFPFRIHFVSPFTRTVIPVTTAAVFGALLLSLCLFLGRAETSVSPTQDHQNTLTGATRVVGSSWTQHFRRGSRVMRMALSLSLSRTPFRRGTFFLVHPSIR